LQGYFIVSHVLKVKKEVCKTAFGLQVKFLSQTMLEVTNYNKIFKLYWPSGPHMLG